METALPLARSTNAFRRVSFNDKVSFKKIVLVTRQSTTPAFDPNANDSLGFLCQLYAAGFHHKSAEQIKSLGDAIGRERILVFHGTRDNMITLIHGEMMLSELGGEEAGVTKSFQEVGHVAPFEIRHEFKRIIADRIDKTEEMPKR